MQSRVTISASCSSVQFPVPAGRTGRTMKRHLWFDSPTRTSTSGESGRILRGPNAASGLACACNWSCGTSAILSNNSASEMCFLSRSHVRAPICFKNFWRNGTSPNLKLFTASSSTSLNSRGVPHSTANTYHPAPRGMAHLAASMRVWC
jgi:hypothetical protein